MLCALCFFFSSRRRHTRCSRDWSSDVCSSDLFMVSTRNPLADRSKITLEEVASQPLIFPRTGYTRQVLDKLFRPYRSRIHVAMELPSVGMIKRDRKSVV